MIDSPLETNKIESYSFEKDYHNYEMIGLVGFTPKYYYQLRYYKGNEISCRIEIKEIKEFKNETCFTTLADTKENIIKNCFTVPFDDYNVYCDDSTNSQNWLFEVYNKNYPMKYPKLRIYYN